MLASFTCEDPVLQDAVFGTDSPTGRLPVELAWSMRAAEASRADVPSDSSNPHFERGQGLTFRGRPEQAAARTC